MKAASAPPKRLRRIIIAAVALIAFLMLLFVPMPLGQMKDGGTKVYRSLTYRVVKWNRLYTDYRQNDDGSHTADLEGIYRKTSVYWFSDAARSDAELWQEEKASPDFRDHLVPD